MKILKAGIIAGSVLTSSGAVAPTWADIFDDAKALDQKAAALVATEGEKAFSKLGDPNGGFIQGELYIVVLDRQGIMRAHRNAKLVGMNMWDEADPDGVKFTQDAIKIAETAGSGWQTYRFPNPVSKKIEIKKAWIEKAGDFVVICGAYTKQ